MLEELYAEHRQSLLTYALSITGCRAAAEDAVHEAMCRLGRDGRWARDPVAYAFTAVRHAAIDGHRRDRRRREVGASLFNGYSPPPMATPDDDMLSAERDRVLRRAVDDLAPVYRETVILKIYGALTFEQISAIVGHPQKTVATRYRRALQQLSASLEGA